MWFSMPEGCGGISVERQEFGVDFRDENGVGYFRAPDHFATKILAIKGFALVENPPVGAPEDLPKADPLRDGAIAELTKTVEAQKTEIQNLRTDMTAANSRVIALTNENTDLKGKVQVLQGTITGLEEQLEDAPHVEVKKAK